MTFLRHVVLEDNILIDFNKIKVALEWQRPKATKKAKSILVLVRYYKWFVEGFDKLA